MASCARYFAKFLLVALLTGNASSAFAQAPDRCEGTLCDLYYGGSAAPSPQPAAPASAKPLTVPNGGFLSNFFGGGGTQATPSGSGAPAQAAAPAHAPLVQVGGGGLLGLARGAPAERCGGSLCDFFYGGPSPEEQREAQRSETPDVTQPTQAKLAPGAAPESDDAPRSTRRRATARDRGGVDYARDQTERPGCVAPAGDPWRCYRK